MAKNSKSPLIKIESRLRTLLPANLYAAAWVDPSPARLTQVFEHLRSLQWILHDYVPRHVLEAMPNPGEITHEWQEGTLMFTDLAGFTPLTEASARHGRAGAEILMEILNGYFAEMIEIISKSGGNLLEFTGDAMLVQFPASERRNDTNQAVRAGLRMQRAMVHYAQLETAQGTFALGMRIGLHYGRFLTADIGTPRRMEHVLLGKAVQLSKKAEGAGQEGKVCLTTAAYERVQNDFRFEPSNREGHVLVTDDLSDEELGEYDIPRPSRRLPTALLLDRSVEGLVSTIEDALNNVEPLASYIPSPILNLVVESTAQRVIPPHFPTLTALFVNFIGLAEVADELVSAEEDLLLSAFSRAFALINAAVESRGGVLKNVTYHLSGSDMLIYFGVPNAHTDDTVRAAATAMAIRDIILNLETPHVTGRTLKTSCQIGLAKGPVFAAEVGEPRGRREFNILGDSVNIAARLMGRSEDNQIMITEAVYHEIQGHFQCSSLGMVALKGKSAATPVYTLDGDLPTESEP
ncbi:MAG: adenylate/guanylate cyclase domain-containing protein [Anaerolineaceae bacterium]|nr:adenylate/guanylate cyclase domain-containing protein [Anaerolineaceae bacterium]